jgi:integrase
MSEPGNRTALVRAEMEEAWTRIKSLVLDSVTSPHSKRAYEQALDAFERWCAETNAAGFTKATVQAYRTTLEAASLAASSINIRLSALRKLAAEAADNGLLAPEVAAAIARVRGAKRQGVRAGNWLTLDQAERLLDLPYSKTKKGKRDRALLALLVGCDAACAGRSSPGFGSKTSSSATAAGASWTWPEKGTVSGLFRCRLGQRLRSTNGWPPPASPGAWWRKRHDSEFKAR